MKAVVFAVSALSLVVFSISIPCNDDSCGGYNSYNYKYMGKYSYGSSYHNQAGYNARYMSGVDADASSGGMGEGQYSGRGGGMGGEGDMNEGGGMYGGGSNGETGSNFGGDSGFGGGRGFGGGSGGGGGGGGQESQGSSGYNYNRRNNYCPTCRVQNFGNGIHNANTINIKRRP